MTVLKTLCTFALAASMFTASGPIASASDQGVSDDGKRKINLAGRQRMLSQRLAKALCFASIGVSTDMHLTMGRDAHSLFEKTLKGLHHGDKEQGLEAEQNPRILAELEGVENLWSGYGTAAAAGLAGQAAAAASLDQVMALNVPVLRQMNIAVGAFEKQYGSSGNIHPALALAINVSGRQRMLSQKASKEFCFIAAGKDVAANRAALASTVSLFDRSLLALMDGDDEQGLPEAPTDEIYEQLELVAELWEPLKAILLKTAAGGTPSAAEIAKVAAENNQLLKEANNAVWMYDNL